MNRKMKIIYLLAAVIPAFTAAAAIPRDSNQGITISITSWGFVNRQLACGGFSPFDCNAICQITGNACGDCSSGTCECLQSC
ncbi:hypothetical protein BJX70DRAFT_369527 [Aspergillus crustosus]